MHQGANVIVLDKIAWGIPRGSACGPHDCQKATSRRARPRWRHSREAGGRSNSKIGEVRFRGQSGHLMLRSGFPAFDPKQSLAAVIPDASAQIASESVFYLIGATLRGILGR